MIVGGVYPGPGPPNAEQTQRFMEPFVDDLIRLYEHGKRVKTARYPQGSIEFQVLLSFLS